MPITVDVSEQTKSHIVLSPRDIDVQERLQRYTDFLKVEPKRPAELRSLLPEIPKTTFYNDIRRLMVATTIRQLPDGRIALQNYSPMTKTIREAVAQYREHYLQEPTLDQLAMQAGQSPAELQDTLYQVARQIGWQDPLIIHLLSFLRELKVRLPRASESQSLPRLNYFEKNYLVMIGPATQEIIQLRGK